jgi:hypothetical protein
MRPADVPVRQAGARHADRGQRAVRGGPAADGRGRAGRVHRRGQEQGRPGGRAHAAARSGPVGVYVHVAGPQEDELQRLPHCADEAVHPRLPARALRGRGVPAAAHGQHPPAGVAVRRGGGGGGGAAGGGRGAGRLAPAPPAAPTLTRTASTPHGHTRSRCRCSRCPDSVAAILGHPDVGRLFEYYREALEQVFQFYATSDARTGACSSGTRAGVRADGPRCDACGRTEVGAPAPAPCTRGDALILLSVSASRAPPPPPSSPPRCAGRALVAQAVASGEISGRRGGGGLLGGSSSGTGATLATPSSFGLTVAGRSPGRATRGVNSMKEALGYGEFLKFASDFDLSSSVILSTLEIGDIFLSSIKARVCAGWPAAPAAREGRALTARSRAFANRMHTPFIAVLSPQAVEPDSSIRKLTFMEFWEGACLRLCITHPPRGSSPADTRGWSFAHTSHHDLLPAPARFPLCLCPLQRWCGARWWRTPRSATRPCWTRCAACSCTCGAPSTSPSRAPSRSGAPSPRTRVTSSRVRAGM